ncbi:hypothetical protein AXF07_07405 [Staphylococcus aureus]|nr:hypothetical protein AB477_08580 [Staphylococcus aureus]MCL9698902.1 hypothetical protein [Staphylococcus aureus]OTG41240.1 hypothetical protein B7G59_00655 [Staphylococcus aureus]
MFTKLICYPQLSLPVEFLYEILCVGPRQLPLPIKILYEILYVGAPPTCTLLKSDFPSAFMLGARPQLPLPVKILYEILCVGPRQLAHY